MNQQDTELKQLLINLRSALPFLREKYHIASMEIFGSYVRSEQNAASDVDILVTFSQMPGLLTFLEIENTLSDRLGRKVDLVMKDSLKPAIGERILKEALTV
jgi:hypothetical protein